jgi:O-antigen ligase
MRIKTKNKNMLIFLGSAMVLFFFSFFLFKFSLLMGLLFLLVVLIFIFTCFYNLEGLFLFILLRPLIDVFTDYNIVEVFNFGLNLASLMGVLIIFFSVYYLIKNFSKFRNNKLFYVWLLFLLVNVISMFFGINNNNSFREVIRLVSIFSLFILGYIFVNTAANLTKSLKAIILSAILPSIIGFWQFFYAKDLFIKNGNRLISTFAHPNMLAFFIFFVLAITIFIFLYGYKKNILSYFYILASLLFFIVLILTYTRGAWLAFLVFLIIIGLFKFRKLLLLMAIFFLILYSAIAPVRERIDNIFVFDDYNSSVVWRLNLYKDEFEYFKKKPIIGYGSGNASLVIAENRSPRLGATEPHNDYLKIALEGGIVGLISYFVLAIVLIKSLFERYKKEIAIKIKYFIFFIIAVFLSLMVASFSNNVLNNTALQWVLWFTIGGVLGLNNYSSKYN